MKWHRMAPAAVLAFAVPAAAECNWEWLCNSEGACKQMPVCGSVYETPPPRPNESKAPAAPALTLRYNTFSGRGVSPGTVLTCEHIMRRDHTGRWYWVEACFCSDRARSRDRSPPFADIVQCEPPRPHR